MSYLKKEEYEVDIIKEIEKVVETENDYQKVCEKILEIANERGEYISNTFDVAQSIIDYNIRPELFKYFVIFILNYQAMESRKRYESSLDQNKDVVILLEMIIATFIARQENYYFIKGLNALNILEKYFIDDKKSYTEAFNNHINFCKEHDIQSDLEAINKLEVLKF